MMRIKVLSGRTMSGSGGRDQFEQFTFKPFVECDSIGLPLMTEIGVALMTKIGLLINER